MSVAPRTPTMLRDRSAIGVLRPVGAHLLAEAGDLVVEHAAVACGVTSRGAEARCRRCVTTRTWSGAPATQGLPRSLRARPARRAARPRSRERSAAPRGGCPSHRRVSPAATPSLIVSTSAGVRGRGGTVASVIRAPLLPSVDPAGGPVARSRLRAGADPPAPVRRRAGATRRTCRRSSRRAAPIGSRRLAPRP